MPEFFKHAMVMLSGAVFAQAIPLLVSPILTRLYTPTQFGVFSSVVALAGILSVIVSLRFDLAIVLPRERRDAANLAALALVAAVGLCLFMWLAGLAFYPWFSHLGMFKGLGIWWHAVPLLTLLIALQQVWQFFANREKKYKAIAAGNVILQITVAIVGIGLGLAMSGVPALNGLVIARLCGFAIGVALLYGSLRLLWRQYRPLVSVPGMREAAVTYRRFPFFNVPYSLAGVFSREFLVLALTSAGQLQAAGLYGFARLLLNAPINFLTAALSQVFYREAATNADTPAFRTFVLRLMAVFAVGLPPVFALAGCWAEYGFGLIFGEKWVQSGFYAAILMPIALLSVLTSWPERIFEVRNRQHWALTIQLSFDLASVLAVVLILHGGHGVTLAVLTYVGIQIAYQLVYLFAVFRLVGLTIRQYAAIVMSIIAGASAALLLHQMTRLGFLTSIHRLIIEGLWVGLLSSAGAWFAYRRIGARFKGVE